MNSFFNPDNPVTVILTRLFDLILLNICFVITTIPVFTAGASLTAMYSVTLRMADGEWGYTAKHYFDAFRREFRQATMLWLLLGGLGAFFSADLYIVYFILEEKLIFLCIPIWLLVVFDVSAMIYVFPMLARYEQTNGQLIRNAILLAIGNIPVTVSIAAVIGLIVDLSIHNGSLRVLFMSIFLFIGFALLARVFSVFFRRIFHSTEDRTRHRK